MQIVSDSPLVQGEIHTLPVQLIATKPPARWPFCLVLLISVLARCHSQKRHLHSQYSTHPGGPEPISHGCHFPLLGGHQWHRRAPAVWTRQSFTSLPIFCTEKDEKTKQNKTNNFNVSWSPLVLLIKTTLITREVCKLATLATSRDTPNLAQIIAGSCLLSGYFNHW